MFFVLTPSRKAMSLNRWSILFVILASLAFTSLRAQAPNILCGLKFPPNSNSIEFVSVNSITGQTNTVTTLANTAPLLVNTNSAINYAAGHYYYIGQLLTDNPNDYRLFEIDAQTGTILNSTLTAGSLNELSFNVADQKLYGLRFDLTGQVLEFVSVTPGSLQITVIDTLPQVVSVASTLATIDPINNRYIFSGLYSTDIGNVLRMYSIDMTTGNILSDPFISTTASGAEFDPASGLVYCFESTPALSFVGYNATTGVQVFAYPIPPAVGMLSSSSVFNPVTRDYIFAGPSSNDQFNMHLFTISAITGQLTNDTIIPDQVLAFEIFKGSEIIGVEEQTNALQVQAFPNPFQDQVTLTCDEVLDADVQLLVTDLAGKQVAVEYTVSGTTIQVQRGTLASGMYGYALLSRKGVLFRGKLVVE